MVSLMKQLCTAHKCFSKLSRSQQQNKNQTPVQQCNVSCSGNTRNPSSERRVCFWTLQFPSHSFTSEFFTLSLSCLLPSLGLFICFDFKSLWFLFDFADWFNEIGSMIDDCLGEKSKDTAQSNSINCSKWLIIGTLCVIHRALAWWHQEK